MFLGLTENGIRKEVACSLEAATICRQREKSALAIPATTILQIASQIRMEFYNTQKTLIRPSGLDICRGILSSLKSLVEDELKIVKATKKQARLPDSHDDVNPYSIDPYGR